MGTVTGMKAEKMQELALGWEQVEADYSGLDGKTSQINARLYTAEALIQQILNGVLPGIVDDLDDLDDDLDDLNDVVLPDLQNDLLNLQVAIDESLSLASDLSTQLGDLNATTLPGLNEELDALSSELTSTFGDVATGIVSSRFPITNVDIGLNAIKAPNIEANAITSVKILADNILAAHILAGEIKTNHMTANTINGDRILVNTLHADKIIANTITSNHLLVQGENLINDPGFESGGLTKHEVGTGTWTAANAASGARTGTRVLQFTLSAGQSGGTMLTTGGPIGSAPSSTVLHPKVSPGDIIRTGFWVKASSGSSFQARVKATVRRVAAPSVDIVTATSSYVAVAHATNWTFVYVEVTVPANTDPNMYVVAQLQGTGGSSGNVVLVDDAIARLRFDGSLIVDGTIYTQHMVANSISGDRIQANTLHADRIIANTIEADRFAATLIMGTRIISGGTITGTKIQTALASAGSGGRMVMNDDEEAGSIKGYFEAGSGWPSTKQVPAGSTPVLINPKLTNQGLGTQRQVLYLSSGGIGGGIARIEIRSGRQNNTLTPEIYMDAQTIFPQLATFQANAKVDTGGTLIYESYSSDGRGVTTASVNAVGAFIRTPPSLRAAKRDVNDLTLEEAQALLKMRPVTFRYKPEYSEDDSIHPGFIAEEVAEAGGDYWTTGLPGEAPTGVRYSEIAVGVLRLVQDHNDRLSRLERALLS